MTDQERETWQNASNGLVWVWKTDRRGELRDELVPPGTKVVIATGDRLWNQDNAASEDLDVFKNGRLVPVRLYEDVEDAAEIANNPNLMTEDDMIKLVKGHHRTLEVRLAEISNATVLHRMVQLAESEDAPVSQLNRINARLEELREAENTVVPVVERTAGLNPY